MNENHIHRTIKKFEIDRLTKKIEQLKKEVIFLNDKIIIKEKQLIKIKKITC